LGTDDPVRQLADAATARADAHDERLRTAEDRVRALELAEAERRGASGGFARIVPWIAILISGGSLIATLWRHP
jgi:hypothetical protein